MHSLCDRNGNTKLFIISNESKQWNAHAPSKPSTSAMCLLCLANILAKRTSACCYGMVCSPSQAKQLGYGTRLCCLFLVFTLPLPPVVLVLQPHSPKLTPKWYSSTHTFGPLLETHCFQKALAPPSGSPKCLRFNQWMTLGTRFTYLLTC